MSQPFNPSIIMKKTANLPDPNIETKIGFPPARLEATAAAETFSNTELDTPLQRLCQKVISGAELIELVQRYGLLPKLQRELIVDTELSTVICSQEEIFSAYKAFYHQHQINSDDDRAAWLKHNHFSLKQFEHLVLKIIKLDRFKQTIFGHRVDSYFLQRKSQIDRAVYSLLRVKDVHLAQELFYRIQAGEADFTELVKQYSGGEEAEINGLVGPQEMSIPHPTLAQALLSLRAGEVAAPVQIADWFILVRLEKYLPAQLDKAMRGRLTDELYELWLQGEVKKLASS
jgi:parvulin-like peptidyl-prolyl isomerase